MTETTIIQAKEFLNNINDKDSVAIIHHDDADGFCSGILFQDYCKSKGAKISTFAYSHSKTKMSKLPLKSFNKIIITDISTKENFKELSKLKDKEIFYIDHHPEYPLPKNVISLLTAKQGYFPSSKTTYELVGGKKWLALIGTLGDAGDLYKENIKFINEILKEIGINLEEFKTKYSHIFSNVIIYFAKNPKKTFQVLSKISSLEEIKNLEKYSNEIEEEIQKTIKEYKSNSEKIGNIRLYYLNPKFNIKGIISSILGKTYPEKIILLLSKKKSDPNFIGLSARHQSKEANLPKLLEAATMGLKNAKCGGHPRASGGQIMTKDLEKFKQNLRNYIKLKPNL